MKKIFTFILLTLFCFKFNAQLLMYEPFNYTPSVTNGINAQSSGLWTNLNTGDSILVADGSLSYSGLAASVGNKVKYDGAGVDNYRSFTTQTSGKIYYSFIVNLTSLGSLNTIGSYAINLLENNSTGNFGACVWFKASSTTGKYNIGLSLRSTSTPVYHSIDLDLNTNYFIVVNYEMINGIGNDISKLWFNPTQFGGNDPTPTISQTNGLNGVNVTDFANNVSRILMRQAAGTTTPFLEIDEIRVGTSWESVTPCATPVTYYADSDGDTFGNPNSTIQACSAPLGYVSNSLDCDDTNAAINPNTIWYADGDGDTYGDLNTTFVGCIPPTGFVLDSIDCDDLSNSVNLLVTLFQDLDGDGYGNPAVSIVNCGPLAGYVSNSTDCNDNSVSQNPGATEIADNIDNDCDGTIDEGFSIQTWYLDTDQDGFGGTDSLQSILSPGLNYTLVGGDCNDLLSSINPNAQEICDGLDNNCDGQIDNGITFLTYYADADQDGYGDASVSQSACSQPSGYVLNNTDCDDTNNAINPNATDIPMNGIDEDCNGQDALVVPVSLGIYEFTQAYACPVLANTVTAQPANATFSTYTNQGGSCTEAANVFNNATWNTGATLNLNNYNEFSIASNSCYNLNLTKLTFTHKVSNVNTIPRWHLRSSIDNFASDIASDSITVNTVLNDTIILGPAFSGINQVTFRFYITGISTPNATWRNDNVSLWGTTTTVTPQTYYADSDGDGFGDAAMDTVVCTAPQGYVSNNTDCDDTNASINPNSIWYVDPNVSTISCLQPSGTVSNGNDCDDTNAQLTTTIMYYVDADGDGFGDEATGVESCSQPQNTITLGGDCDDTNDQIYPGAQEICDGLDNNCNGSIDEGLNTVTYYVDSDNDGFGIGSGSLFCNDPGTGFSLNNLDCDDSNNQINPTAVDIIDNGIDENCDGVDGLLTLADNFSFSSTIQPNPTFDNSILAFSSQQKGELFLRDLNGKIVYSKSFNQKEVEIVTTMLITGTYIIEINISGVNFFSRLMKL
jgi:hypothetical protein